MQDQDSKVIKIKSDQCGQRIYNMKICNVLSENCHLSLTDENLLLTSNKNSMYIFCRI